MKSEMTSKTQAVKAPAKAPTKTAPAKPASKPMPVKPGSKPKACSTAGMAGNIKACK